MTISSIPKSTQPTQPPTPRYVELKNSSPETERLAQLVGFLEENAAKGVGLYAETNVDPNSNDKFITTTFYLAKDAEDMLPPDPAAGDKPRPSPVARPVLARIELGNLLRACIKEKNVDGTGPGAKADGIMNKIRGLLNDAISQTTGTTGTPRPGMRDSDRSSPPPAPLDSLAASKLVDVVAEYVSEFQDVDAAAKVKAEAELAKQHKPPVFPRNLNKQIGKTDLNLPDGTAEKLPNLELGGNVFKPIMRLEDESSYQVLFYKHEDSGETKLVKLPRGPRIDPTKPEETKPSGPRTEFISHLNRHLKDFKAELDAELKYANREENVLGFTEHVNLPNGTVALICSDGVRDDVRNFGEKLDEAFSGGEIGRYERGAVALTLTQDVIRGAAWLEKNGTYHGDMKPENQIIDANGVAHLVLPSFSGGDLITRLRRLQLQPDNPYRAPEAERRRQDEIDENESSNRISSSEKKRKHKLNAKLLDLVPPEIGSEAPEDLKKSIPLFVKAAWVLGKGAYGIDSKADVFGAGGTYTWLLEKMSPDDLHAKWRVQEQGKSNLTDMLDENDKQKALKKLAAMKMSKLDTAIDPSMTGVSSADTVGYITPVRDPTANPLLDLMLPPNRENRIGLQEVLELLSMPYGARKGVSPVGSPEVRKLIQAIMARDVDKIKDARKKLLAAYPEPEPDPVPELKAAPVPATPSASGDANGAPPPPSGPGAEPGPDGNIRFDR